MRRLLACWLYGCLLAALAGCAVSVRPARVADSVELKDDEGIIVYQSWLEFEEAKAMQFTVAPGKINYIGHIEIPSTSEKRGTLTVVLISDPVATDRSVEARIWLDENQPSLKQMYEFVEALAVAPPRREQPGQ